MEGNKMGEYNDTIQELSQIQQEVIEALEIYCEGAISCYNLFCSRMLEHSTSIPQDYSKRFKEWLEECRAEINSFKISGRGEVYYKSETYTKSNVKNAIANHRKGMVFPFLIDSSQKLNEIIEKYFKFLNEFAKMVSK